MKICSNCQKVCKDDDNFCSSCGSTNFVTENTAYQNCENSQNNQNTQQNGSYYNPYYDPNSQSQNYNSQGFECDNMNSENMDKKNIDDAKICGILSLAIIIFGLVGLSWIPALIGKNKLKNVVSMRDSGEFGTAKLLNNIGMILSIISIVIGVLVCIVQIILVVAGVGFGMGFLNEFVDIVSEAACII